MRKRSKESREFLQALGRTIKELRLSSGLHQEQVGARVGISGSRIGEIERGVVSTSADRIRAIAGALGVTTTSLYRQTEISGFSERMATTLRARVVETVRRLGTEELDLVAQLVLRLRAGR